MKVIKAILSFILGATVTAHLLFIFVLVCELFGCNPLELHDGVRIMITFIIALIAFRISFSIIDFFEKEYEKLQ